jgi:hypothetical protein
MKPPWFAVELVVDPPAPPLPPPPSLVVTTVDVHDQLDAATDAATTTVSAAGITSFL